MMGDRERGLEVMTRLRAMGIRIALDDFGTGYSSLSYLAAAAQRDQGGSFLRCGCSSIDKLRIVRTIVDLTHDLGMESLAEGVEDVAQRDQLLALGCTRMQGYLYAADADAEFITWYRAFQA
jgi:EAL domain-containing protein (putative c-di-GMP-specific phosphodiesterase class I)